MESRIIKISKNKIYFTDNASVGLKQTNFPEGTLSFRHHVDIYLEVELSKYDKSLKTLEIKIIDYAPQDIKTFYDQKLKKPIDQLIFKELDWEEFKKLLSSFLYSLPKKIPEAFKKVSKRENLDIVVNAEGIEKVIFDDNENEEDVPTQLEIITRNLNFSVLFSEALFHLGYISVIKKFPFLKNSIELKITNNLILPEYHYIKNYFSNYYQSDSFDISTIIKTKGEEILSIDCNSNTIESIDDRIIENVKTVRTLNISKIEANKEDEKSTYNADEILSELDGSSNVFDQSEIEILITIIESKSPRNVKQLMYLSGEKHERTKKIRFTLNPLFGFIFFISGKKKNHICWELLDSHATYLWSFEKEISIESQIQLSELNINTIREIGRMKYRSRIKNKQIDINSSFYVINHSKSKTKDDFELWKNKLTSKII